MVCVVCIEHYGPYQLQNKGMAESAKNEKSQEKPSPEECTPDNSEVKCCEYIETVY